MKSYPFRFNVRKTIQAIGVLVADARNKTLNYMKLLKLLYIADRESLKDRALPITGDRPVAMPRGPVPEGVYDLIRGKRPDDQPLWQRHFLMRDYHIELVQFPSRDLLSLYEIKKLQEVFERYRSKDEFDMVRIVHRLPEWIKNDPGKSSCHIPLEDILDGVGKPSLLKAAEDHAKIEQAAERIFGP